MYQSFRQLCERLLRIPRDPASPPGDEASTRIFRAAPNYYRYLFALWAVKSGFTIVVLLTVAVVVAAGLLGSRRHGLGWGAWLMAAIPLLLLGLDIMACLVRLAILRLDFEKRWYVVTDRSLRIREGVVTVREMTVNFANIQNISISQGPIQRLLGIADLRVDTAGGGGSSGGHEEHTTENLHTAWFRGIHNAAEVRELIQQRLHVLKDSGLGDREELLSAPDGAASTPAAVASPSLLAVLREVHAEAGALRQAALKAVREA